jgi:hypothetical protein
MYVYFLKNGHGECGANNFFIITKLKDKEEKKFYIEEVKNYGWSRNELNI